MAKIDDVKTEITNKLKEKFGENAVSDEYGGPARFILHVVTDEFKGKDDDERQDEVWSLIHKEFNYSDFKYIGLVMTWTPEEKEAYDREQVA
jgi:stress-induced morphogen